MVTSNPWANKDSNSVATLIAVSSSDGTSIVRLWADPITHRLLVDNSGGGGGFTELPATGTVNGLNAVFGFTQQPTYIVSDSAIYKPLDNNGNVQWTWNSGTSQATMTIPPSSSIFGWI